MYKQEVNEALSISAMSELIFVETSDASLPNNTINKCIHCWMCSKTDYCCYCNKKLYELEEYDVLSQDQMSKVI